MKKYIYISICSAVIFIISTLAHGSALVAVSKVVSIDCDNPDFIKLLVDQIYLVNNINSSINFVFNNIETISNDSLNASSNCTAILSLYDSIDGKLLQYVNIDYSISKNVDGEYVLRFSPK